MVRHQCLALKSTYEVFNQNIEKVLNRLDTKWFINLETEPESVKKYLDEVAGSTGLMIFGDEQHGKLLNIIGKPRKAVQYWIGNPLTALKMTKHDIRAALYAPVRILIFESDDRQLYAEYDLPSSQFGQFGNNDIISVAKTLDQKLEAAILKGDNLKF